MHAMNETLVIIPKDPLEDDVHDWLAVHEPSLLFALQNFDLVFVSRAMFRKLPGDWRLVDVIGPEEYRTRMRLRIHWTHAP